MVVAVRATPSGKGGGPKLSMLELVSVANNRYKISKLRKRSVGPAFCYVCSRVDPSGLLSKTNAHLYRKGFFQACEHFPKAPSSTFVEEEGRLFQEDRYGTHTGTNLTKVPSISVTIRKGSRSTSFQSPLKRERTFDSSYSRTDRHLGSRENSFMKSSVAESAEVRLPSICAAATENNAQTPLSKVSSSKLQVPAINDVTKPPFSKESFKNATGTLPSLNVESRGGGSLSERITVIPTALEEQTSPITGLSSFSKGTTPSATTNDLETKMSESEIISNGSQVLIRSARSNGDKQSSKASALSSVSESLSGRRLDPSALFINRSDGLSAIIQPLVREPVLLDLRELPTAQSRPKAGRRRLLNRRRHGGCSSDESARSERPESAHLRYHHRAEEDSVPDPGFEIPPTPSLDSMSLSVSMVSKAGDDTNLSPEERRQSRSKSEREPRKSQVHHEGLLVGMSSDDDDEEDGSSSGVSYHTSEKFEFCRCPTNVRDISFSRNVCKTCENAYYASDAGSTQTRSLPSLKGTSRTTDASQSRVKQAGKKHHSGADGSTDDVTEFDVKDGQYWSSDDEDFPSHFDESPSAWIKYKHAQPYPLVDPNIHKFVYMQAINAVQLNAIANAGDDYKFDEIEKLRRPHVFSYIPLLKRKVTNDTVARSIGLRPVKSPKIRNGQYMRHIFGDINPDDFYPSRSRGNRLVFDGASRTTDSDTVTSDDESDKTDKGMQPVLTERSSVSLKMRKEGVNFSNEESAEV
ncbi:uncharacterized protein LOC127858453 [Dreissena polymorpha]|uniref:uncharacterized protein LOC127858453 n=1 Tax=Dreissena polymorpha TaxID=45954 RepID=UPI0022642D05|nr:uncharacterized protein LOC127858453 [Dreissena polymorpha]